LKKEAQNQNNVFETTKFYTYPDKHFKRITIDDFKENEIIILDDEDREEIKNKIYIFLL